MFDRSIVLFKTLISQIFNIPSHRRVNIVLILRPKYAYVCLICKQSLPVCWDACNKVYKTTTYNENSMTTFFIHTYAHNRLSKINLRQKPNWVTAKDLEMRLVLLCLDCEWSVGLGFRACERRGRDCRQHIKKQNVCCPHNAKFPLVEIDTPVNQI